MSRARSDCLVPVPARREPGQVARLAQGFHPGRLREAGDRQVVSVSILNPDR